VDTDVSAIDDLIPLSRKLKDYVQVHLGPSEDGGRWGLPKVVSFEPQMMDNLQTF
jgi:hypothetical protein